VDPRFNSTPEWVYFVVFGCFFLFLGLVVAFAFWLFFYIIRTITHTVKDEWDKKPRQ